MVTYLRLIEGAIKGIGVGTGGGVSHIKVTGMLVVKFKLNPQGRPMWVWFKLKLTPKGDFWLVRVGAFLVNFVMHSTNSK